MVSPAKADRLPTPRQSQESCTGFTIISTTHVSTIHNSNCLVCLKHVVMCGVSSKLLKCRAIWTNCLCAGAPTVPKHGRLGFAVRSSGCVGTQRKLIGFIQAFLSHKLMICPFSCWVQPNARICSSRIDSARGRRRPPRASGVGRRGAWQCSRRAYRGRGNRVGRRRVGRFTRAGCTGMLAHIAPRSPVSVDRSNDNNK